MKIQNMFTKRELIETALIIIVVFIVHIRIKNIEIKAYHKGFQDGIDSSIVLFNSSFDTSDIIIYVPDNRNDTFIKF